MPLFSKKNKVFPQKSSNASSSIKNLFDTNALHWLNTSKKQLLDIIETEAIDELRTFIVKIIQEYVFGELNIFARQKDVDLIVHHYFREYMGQRDEDEGSLEEEVEAQEKEMRENIDKLKKEIRSKVSKNITNKQKLDGKIDAFKYKIKTLNKKLTEKNDQVKRWYLSLFGVFKNAYGKQLAEELVENPPTLSESANLAESVLLIETISRCNYELKYLEEKPSEEEKADGGGRERKQDELKMPITEHSLYSFEFKNLDMLLNTLYRMVKRLLLVNSNITKQVDYCNNIIFNDFKNEHMKRLILRLYYEDNIVNAIMDKGEIGISTEVQNKLLVDMNKPKLDILTELSEIYKNERERLVEVEEEQEKKIRQIQAKREASKKQKLRESKDSSSSSSSSESESDDDEGKQYNSDGNASYNSDFENEEITAEELSDLYSKFQSKIDNLPSVVERKVQTEVLSKEEISAMKNELKFLKKEAERNELEKRIEMAADDLRKYRDKMLERKMLRVVTKQNYEFYTTEIKNDLYERLELSETAKAMDISDDVVLNILALSQINQGTSDEVPVIGILRSYAAEQEKHQDVDNNVHSKWLPMIVYMVEQFLNYKILLQENLYRFNVLQVDGFNGHYLEKLLYLRNKNGVKGQLGCRDVETNEFPIIKAVKFYNTIPPDGTNKIKRKQLRCLISQMINAGPANVLLCEEVYGFLSPVCLHNFLHRCGGIRKVLLQTDSNGNNPIFFAIENLDFQGTSQVALRNQALFKYMITGKMKNNVADEFESDREVVTDTVYASTNWSSTVLRSHDSSFKNSRDTALHRAVYYEKIFAVKVILKADPGIRCITNSDNMTPLQLNIDRSKLLSSSGGLISDESSKINEILSGSEVIEKIFQNFKIRNDQKIVEVPIEGKSLKGFLLSELLKRDTKARDVILKYNNKTITAWKMESPSSVSPENMPKFNKKKSRAINAILQLEFEHGIRNVLEDHRETEISDLDYLRELGLGLCYGSLSDFMKKQKLKLSELLKNKELALKWIDYILKDSEYMDLIGITEIEKNRLTQWKYWIQMQMQNANVINLDPRDWNGRGEKLSTSIFETRPTLAKWFEECHGIVYFSDLISESSVASLQSYKLHMTSDQINYMHSVGNIRERFRFCDIHSGGLRSGSLGMFTNMFMTKLNYFFEEGLKHKRIWKIDDDDELSVMGKDGKHYALSTTLQDCKCISSIFDAAIRKFKRYVMYLNQSENEGIPLDSIKTISSYICSNNSSRTKLLSSCFKAWKKYKANHSKKSNIASSIRKQNEHKERPFSPIRQNVIKAVEKRLFDIFDAVKREIITVDANGNEIKQKGLSSEDIAVHFYKNSNNGRIGLSDFATALRQLGINIQPNESHELMKIISGGFGTVQSKLEQMVDVGAFINFINKGPMWGNPRFVLSLDTIN
jgi:hypothetical protein